MNLAMNLASWRAPCGAGPFGRMPLGLVLTALSTGCAVPAAPGQAFLGMITPYRIDIVQGNAVTREQIAQRLGCSVRTVASHWSFAREWLRESIEGWQE